LQAIKRRMMTIQCRTSRARSAFVFPDKLDSITSAAAAPALFAPTCRPVAASTASFLLSELPDFLVHTPLQSRGLVLAVLGVLASSVVGLIADSPLFLWLAFGDLAFLERQIVGKTWMVLLSLPAVNWIRKRDAAIGLPVVK
jgi:uncharacterized PurR-regulated membrane protein YhhQ (DUF165 family)